MNHANTNPDSRQSRRGFLARRFPNGTTAIAAHYRDHIEAWPGGFHRDAKKDAEILRQNPLPSSKIALRDFACNGHRITYDGDLTVAFRPGGNGRLAAFAGHGCKGITIDGREHAFADSPMATIAWAPVSSERRVSGGAALELWVQGNAVVTVPLPGGMDKGALYASAARPGGIGGRIDSTCEAGRLRFQSTQDKHQQRLFFVPS